MVINRMDPRCLSPSEIDGQQSDRCAFHELRQYRVIESIGSDQIMDVHDELVHFPNTEVVLGKLRGLQQSE